EERRRHCDDEPQPPVASAEELPARAAADGGPGQVGAEARRRERRGLSARLASCCPEPGLVHPFVFGAGAARPIRHGGSASLRTIARWSAASSVGAESPCRGSCSAVGTSVASARP